MNQRTLDIWGAEIKALQDKSIAVVKANEKLTGYDWSQHIKEKYRKRDPVQK